MMAVADDVGERAFEMIGPVAVEAPVDGARRAPSPLTVCVISMPSIFPITSSALPRMRAGRRQADRLRRRDVDDAASSSREPTNGIAPGDSPRITRAATLRRLASAVVVVARHGRHGAARTWLALEANIGTLRLPRHLRDARKRRRREVAGNLADGVHLRRATSASAASPTSVAEFAAIVFSSMPAGRDRLLHHGELRHHVDFRRHVDRAEHARRSAGTRA